MGGWVSEWVSVWTCIETLCWVCNIGMHSASVHRTCAAQAQCRHNVSTVVVVQHSARWHSTAQRGAVQRGAAQCKGKHSTVAHSAAHTAQLQVCAALAAAMAAGQPGQW